MQLKIITIKLTKASPKSGPFTIKDELGNIIASNVPKKDLILGMSFTVNDSINVVNITSTGECQFSKNISLKEFSIYNIINSSYKEVITACLWRHLTTTTKYNFYYGKISPYIIEYPLAYKFQDEILQNVKDCTKAYKYFPSIQGVYDDNLKVETNNVYFNKAILYNGQQSSGILNLVPKPVNNLKEYLKYPMYHSDSKTITYTKSDNFYQFNTFWALNKSSQIPLFSTSCNSLSIDKIVNQDNMDYGKRSFKKAPLKAKDLKVRMILDDTSDIHLVSQIFLTNSQISYK